MEPSKRDSSGKVLAVFQACDENSDGVISKMELSHTLKKLDATYWDDDQVDGLFHAIDAHKTGKIEYDELVTWLFDRPTHALFHTVWTVVAKNRDGHDTVCLHGENGAKEYVQKNTALTVLRDVGDGTLHVQHEGKLWNVQKHNTVSAWTVVAKNRDGHDGVHLYHSGKMIEVKNGSILTVVGDAEDGKLHVQHDGQLWTCQKHNTESTWSVVAQNRDGHDRVCLRSEKKMEHIPNGEILTVVREVDDGTLLVQHSGKIWNVKKHNTKDLDLERQDSQKSTCSRTCSKSSAEQKSGAKSSDEHKAAHAECATLAEIATAMQRIYKAGYEFPTWSIDMLAQGQLEDLRPRACIYYKQDDNIDLVKRIATEREPVNIAMGRHYDTEQLKARFKYTKGAYGDSSDQALMPNIAIYCQTPMCSADLKQKEIVHVINSIGYAFDSPDQPDFKYFFTDDGKIVPEKWEELKRSMTQMWTFIYACAKRNNLKRVYLADVGGGFFATILNASPGTSYDKLKSESLPPVQNAYPDIETKPLPRVPDFVFSDEGRPHLNDSLFVNAWDPWSMVGNGNSRDNSLDGYFGRCSAMAVICWPCTNPALRYEQVEGLS